MDVSITLVVVGQKKMSNRSCNNLTRILVNSSATEDVAIRDRCSDDIPAELVKQSTLLGVGVC